MAIYLDGLRRCDNCLHELGTALAIRCKGEDAYRCRKELCLKCRLKRGGYCTDCLETEFEWWFEDFELDLWPEQGEKTYAQEMRMLDQWNKLAQA